jgi:hypothetical protein
MMSVVIGVIKKLDCVCKLITGINSTLKKKIDISGVTTLPVICYFKLLCYLYDVKEDSA